MEPVPKPMTECCDPIAELVRPFWNRGLGEDRLCWNRETRWCWLFGVLEQQLTANCVQFFWPAVSEPCAGPPGSGKPWMGRVLPKGSGTLERWDVLELEFLLKNMHREVYSDIVFLPCRVCRLTYRSSYRCFGYLLAPRLRMGQHGRGLLQQRAAWVRACECHFDGKNGTTLTTSEICMRFGFSVSTEMGATRRSLCCFLCAYGCSPWQLSAPSGS